MGAFLLRIINNLIYTNLLLYYKSCICACYQMVYILEKNSKMKSCFHSLLVTFCYIISSTSYAMEHSPVPEDELLVKPSALSVKPVEEINWSLMDTYIERGLKLSSAQESVSLSSEEIASVNATSITFKTQFLNYFHNKHKPTTLKSMRELKTLLNLFYKYLVYSCAADMGHIRSSASPYARYGVLDRESMVETKPTRDPFFHELQSITNLLFGQLEQSKIFEFSHHTGIISVTDAWKIGYFTDENGYVPFSFLTREYDQYLTLGWGKQDPMHQKNVLIRGGEFVSDSGFILNLSPMNNFKVTGYYGENSQFPYTQYRITAHVSPMVESPLIESIKRSMPDSIVTGKQKLRENEAFFISIPSTPQEYALLEILFLEDLMEETHTDSRTNKNVLAFLKQLSFEESIEDQTGKLEGEILSEYEAQVKKEQELRSQRVRSGQIYKQKGAAKKSKGKRKGKAKSRGINKGKATQSAASLIDTKQPAKDLYKKYKAEGRTKYNDILRILNCVVKEYPSGLSKLSISIKGSHINVHGEHDGFTIVKPHGGKRALPAYTVNKILSQLIELISEQ